MKRIYLVMAAILVSLFAFSCGGGSGQVADPNTPAGGNGDQKDNLILSVDAPSSVRGDQSVREIPGRLEITTAVEDTELQAVLDRYGYSLINRDGNRASISVPNEIDLKLAAADLQKEYAVASASPAHLINTPTMIYDTPRLDISKYGGNKGASFLPVDPMFGDVYFGFFFDGVDTSITNFIGQRTGIDANGFQGAWDVAFSDTVNVNPVSVAIIDAGWFDYSTVDRADLDEAGQLDATNSGSVDGGGTFTSGLAAAAWDTFDDGGIQTPFRTTGDILLGIMAAPPNNWAPNGFDLDGSTDLTADEIWNEGIAGVAPFANYMLIKTGTESGGNWTFSDAEIAASIDHAVSAGANIILLGMFGNGAVGAPISTALQNAADNDVLCIAPAGDIVFSFNGTDFGGDTPVDISVNPVSPASDPNCLSVCLTGPNKHPYTGDIDVTGDEVPDFANPNTGWFPRWGAPFAERFFEVPAVWANSGGDIAACSASIGFGTSPFLNDGASVIPGHNYNGNISRFSSANAAAYVAGAAALTFQALTSANGGTPPTDDEVRQVLLDNVNEFVDITGSVSSGLLNASKCVNAVAGGGVSGPAMGLSVPAGQLVPATLLTTFQLAPAVTGGTGPFDLSIDWGNGDAATVVNNWASNDPVALTGGWDTLGLKTVLITVSETTGDMRSANRTVEIPVYNAITSNLTVMGPIDPQDPGQGEKLFTPAQPIQDAVTYTFSANVANVFNGSVDGTPNNPQFGWDFDGDNVIDKPGTTVEHAFINTGSFNIKFIVTQDVLPDFEVTRTVLVN
ncbi:hypothetical protein KDL29_14805 [bacterium]|nr:hypothetical protein [bacterium]